MRDVSMRRLRPVCNGRVPGVRNVYSGRDCANSTDMMTYVCMCMTYLGMDDALYRCGYLGMDDALYRCGIEETVTRSDVLGVKLGSKLSMKPYGP